MPLTIEDPDQEDSSPFSEVTGSKIRTATANMAADIGAQEGGLEMKQANENQ